MCLPGGEIVQVGVYKRERNQVLLWALLVLTGAMLFVDHFHQSGAQSAEELLQKVTNANATARNAQLCEAHYFIGQQQALAGDEQAAAEHFQKAVETGVRHLSAYRGAEFALQRVASADRGRRAPAPLR